MKLTYFRKCCYKQLQKKLPTLRLFLHEVLNFSYFDTLLSNASVSFHLSPFLNLNKCYDVSEIMDDDSARGHLFQLKSLSVFSNQLSYHLEEDTHTYTRARTHTHTMELVEFNLGLFISFHNHHALTGPP